MMDWKKITMEELSRHIGITQAKSEKLVNRYYDAVVDGLKKGYLVANKLQRSAGHFPISTTKLYEITVQAKGRRFYIHNEISSINPLINIVEKGSNLTKKLTIVTTDIPLEEILVLGNPMEVVKFYYKEHIDAINEHTDNNPKYDAAEIDIVSLNNYITNTSWTINHTSNQKFRKALQEYLHKAKSILQIAKSNNGFLPQIIKESDFGRKYYTGLNLQNCPVVVREAALGKCIKVDVENSVFQWRYDSVKDITNEQVFQYTSDYLEFKKSIRKKLVKTVFHGNETMSDERKMSLIKQSMTAIGFGAKARDSSYWGAYSLREIYTPHNSKVVNKVQLERFINDDFIKGFIEEQKVISDIIFQYSKEYVRRFEQLKDRRGISRAKVLAFLYQHYERYLMKGAIEQIKEKILLEVHDGFYAKDLSLDERLGIKQYFSDMKIPISFEKLDAYQYVENYDDEVQCHKDFIRQEEEKQKNAR